MSLEDLERRKSLKDREPELSIPLSNGGREEVYVLDEWESAGASGNSGVYSGPSIVTRKVGHGVQELEKYVSDPNFWRWLQQLVDGRNRLKEALEDEGLEDLGEEIVSEEAEAYRDDLDDFEPPQEQFRDLSKLEKLKIFGEKRIGRGSQYVEDILQNDVHGRGEPELSESQREELREISDDLNEALWDLRDFLNENLD